MAKPKWLFKPVDLFKTRYGGFMIEGEGVILSYKKSDGGSLSVQYFIHFFNRLKGKNAFMFDGNYFSNMQNVRSNLEINKKFSKTFKFDLLKSIFESTHPHDIRTIKEFSQKIKEHDLGKYFG